MKYNKFAVFYAAIVLAGCDNESNSKPSVSTTPASQKVTLESHDITLRNQNELSFRGPGITASNLNEVKGLSSNFGVVSLDAQTGDIVFQSISGIEALSANAISSELVASQHHYQFEVKYNVANTQYTILGYALPQYAKESGEIVTRFSKVDQDGKTLDHSEQVLPMKKQDWTCVVDNKTELTWQTLQSNGDYAFDSTYYWGDRTINHRDYSQAVCGLGTDCNTDNLIAAANASKLCGISDWRLPTKKEWQSLLNLKMLSDEQRISPIDSFYFPYLDANYDEAYWTGTFTQYPEGHDNTEAKDDWQGSNEMVGDAYVAWMGGDFANEKNPPHSTNEPWFSMLVHGPMIPDDTIESVELKREIVKSGDENTRWQQRFVKLGNSGQLLNDQTVTDWACTDELLYRSVLENTRILWQRVDKGEPLMSYAHAEQYVKTINAQSLCGRNDWRLPTEKELKTLLVDDFYLGMEDLSYRPGYVNSVFNDTVVGDNSYYWTSTKSDTKRMAVAFQSEWAESSAKSMEHFYRVRLISTSKIKL